MFNFKNAVYVFSIMVFVACSSEKTSKISKGGFDIINDAVKSRLEVAAKKFEAEGIEAAAQYCAENQEALTSSGTIVIECTVCAEFYDPKDKAVVKGKDIILSVGKNMLY